MPQARRKKPLKILIVAEHASAIFGGEALIPYQYFKYLREMDVDVHLLVHERTRRRSFVRHFQMTLSDCISLATVA